MSKRSVIDDAFLDKYVDIKIEYPFCYETPNRKNFFRYLEDGRYEYVCLEEKKATLGFGSRANSIGTLIDEDGFYFKVLANLNTVITNEEFELRRDLFSIEYTKYLDGSKYLSMEVQKEIDKKEKQNGIKKEESPVQGIVGIITGNINEPDAF